MHSARAHIADHCAHIFSKFALYREIPLHHVISARMGIKICLAGVGRTRYERKCIARKRSGREVGSASRLKERRREEFVELDEIGEGQNVEHPESRADGGLAAPKRVPR